MLPSDPRGADTRTPEKPSSHRTTQLMITRTKFSISQSFRMPDSDYSGFIRVIHMAPSRSRANHADHHRRPQDLPHRIVARNRDWSHSLSVVRKPHSPVVGLPQCRNPRPTDPASSMLSNLAGKAMIFSVATQACPRGREQIPYHVRVKFQTCPVLSIVCPRAGPTHFGASPDSSVMIAGEAMNGGIRQFFGSGKHCQSTVSQET